MIHSLAGGKMRDLEIVDLAKVEYLQGDALGKLAWYKTNILDLKIDDIVLVPFGQDNTLIQAKVKKIEKNVSQVSPISLKHAKEIFKKI